MLDSLLAGEHSEYAWLALGKLDWGQGPDHLRHMLWAASLDVSGGDLGAAVVVYGGALKEVGDALVHAIQSAAGIPADWDGWSDMHGNMAGLRWGEAVQENPATPPSAHLRFP